MKNTLYFEFSSTAMTKSLMTSPVGSLENLRSSTTSATSAPLTTTALTRPNENHSKELRRAATASTAPVGRAGLNETMYSLSADTVLLISMRTSEEEARSAEDRSDTVPSCEFDVAIRRRATAQRRAAEAMSFASFERSMNSLCYVCGEDRSGSARMGSEVGIMVMITVRVSQSQRTCGDADRVDMKNSSIAP
jgi:hypothetical protein